MAAEGGSSDRSGQRGSTGIFQPVKDSDKVGKASNVNQALIWVHKAKAGSIKWVDNCSQEQFNYYCLAKKMKILGTMAKYGLLLCTIFDMPSWCRGTPENCAAYNVTWYAPGFTVLPYRTGAGISLVFWAILAIRAHVRKLAMGDAYAFTNWQMFTGVVLLIGGASAAVAVAFPMVYNLSVLCRPFAFLCCTKSLRNGVAHVVRSIPGYIDVLLALAICVFVCVWMGMVMFARTPEGYADFFAWRQGFAQMWILFTTNNTPNVIMPAYNKNRCYFWFFFVYLLVTVFLLGNVLLGKVYDTYKEVVKDDLHRHIENQKASVTRAFSFLSDSVTGIISPETWREFFVAYCDPNLGSIEVGNPDDMAYNVKRANQILKTVHDVDVDDEMSNGINFDQFKKITSVFFNQGIFIASKRPPTAEFKFECWKQLNHFFLNGHQTSYGKITWDGSMDVVITIGTMMVFYQSWCFAHVYNTQGIYINFLHRIDFWIMFSFSIYYAFCITVKISSLGLERFWYKKPMQHRFDFFNVYGLLIISLVFVCGFPRSIVLMRMIMLFHMARGLRLFWYIEPLRQFFSLMVRLVPVYAQMGMILFIVFWVFTDIGQLWFGGMIYTTNPNLDHTDFKAKYNSFQFFELNFNCFLDGMITLFTLLCMNNWSDTADGYMKASQSYMSQAFFVSFTVIANLIVLNILIALILDCTGVVSEELEKEAANAAAGMGVEGEIEGAAGGASASVDVMARLLGEDEQQSSDDDSSSSEDEDVDPAAKKPDVSMSRTMSRKQTGGKKKTTLAPDLTKEEKKRFDKLVANSPTKGKRASIG